MIRSAAIMAAGHGARLHAPGAPPKPLVAVAGRPLIERVLRSVAETNPRDVTIIVNEASGTVRDHVDGMPWPFALHWIVETTPSSMHSFLRVVEAMAHRDAEGPFLVSTVDTVVTPGAFAAFASRSAAVAADIVLAATPLIDDEKPLLIRVDHATSRVVALGQPAAGAGRRGDEPGAVYATAGYYTVRPSILAEAEAARREGLGALRLFLARLLANGYRVAAVSVGDSVDVDRPYDVMAAETLVRQVGA